MSDKNISMKNSIFISLLFCLGLTTSRAQEIIITGGTGTPEMVNIGVRMQVDQFQYGLSIGGNPAYKNENFNMSADLYYHFGGSSNHTNLRPWFVKGGLTYMQNEGEWERRMNLLLVPRLGREFNITEQFGFALEAGFMLMLIDENQAKKERTDEVTGDLDLIGSGFILPSAGLKIFYRFLE